MDRSSSRMEKFAVGRRGSQPSGSAEGRQDASNSPRSSVRASAIAQPLIFNLSSAKNFCVVLALATTYLSVVSAQEIFSYPGTTYNCSWNCICLGAAHELLAPRIVPQNSEVPAGSLSLLPEKNNTPNNTLNTAGGVYSNNPVQLLDHSTNTAMSFKTYFAVTIIEGIDDDGAISERGDGMAFVISADNSTLGSNGSALGVYDRSLSYTTTTKHVVVEFDAVHNKESPIYDINDNHVSFDFMSITASATADAGDTDLASSFYAWVEYSNETRQLQVRVSASNHRPRKPLLSYRVDLSKYVEEYMWVGFTAGSGGLYCNYYVQNWTFALTTSGGRNWRLIVGLSVGVTVPVACIIFFVVHRKYGRGGGRYRDLNSAWFTLRHPVNEEELASRVGVPTSFTYRELSVACKNFGKESELGEGGFGSVYSGVLPSSNCPVAVKKIKDESKQGEREFMAEVSIITQLRHGNLIQLLGWCLDASKNHYLLVYDLMPNGSLDKKLFGPAEKQPASLSWERRFKIVTGTAAALEYLHHRGGSTHVIHRDIKSSNIMLDEEWNAKLGDFGLARLVDPKRETEITGLAGTRGYLAPEVAISYTFSVKSDVYGFGAVVLEVACGRKAWSPHLPPDQKQLVPWVWNSLSRGDLMTAVDQRLEEYDAKEMEMMLNIGLLCSHPDPLLRPSMRSVVQWLAGDAPVPSVPRSMPTFGLSSVPPLGSESTSTSLVSYTRSHSSPGSTTRFFSIVA